jgi:hypothetical protein
MPQKLPKKPKQRLARANASYKRHEPGFGDRDSLSRGDGAIASKPT